MPDLDAELANLRDRMRTSIAQPDLARVAEWSRQRVVRRRMQLGAVAAVVVVSAAVPVLRSQAPPDPDRPATPPASATASPSPGMEVPKTPFVDSVDFADADHGYAVRASCPSGKWGGDCTFDLMATTDGEHWRARQLPRGESGDDAVGRRLYVLGPTAVAIDYGPSQRIYSADAGRTWRAVPEPIAAGTTATVAVTLPESGQTVALANQPPLDRPTIPGGDQASTADGTWLTNVLPTPGEPSHTGWSLVERDGLLYTTVTGDGLGLLAIFESTDGPSSSPTS